MNNDQFNKANNYKPSLEEIKAVLDRCWELDREGRYEDSDALTREFSVYVV